MMELINAKQLFLAHLKAILSAVGMTFPNRDKYMGIQQGLKDGTLSLRPHVIYGTTVVTGSQTVKVFDSGDQEEKGLRNIKARKLEASQNFMPNKIRVTAIFDDTNPIDDAAIKAGKFVALDQLPTASDGTIQNGIMTITSKSGTFTKEYPLSGFLSGGKTTQRAGELILPDSEIFLAEDQLQIEFEFPEQITGNHAIKVELDGVQTTTKG